MKEASEEKKIKKFPDSLQEAKITILLAIRPRWYDSGFEVLMSPRRTIFPGCLLFSRSAVTIFVEKAQSMSAQRKIAMLRLFLDTLDLSEPGDDGWTIIGPLIRTQHKETASLVTNSIMWFLQKFSTDNMIAFAPRTIWHGLQHALRAFLALTQEARVLQKLISLGVNTMNEMINGSHALSIARWMALRATGRHLLPMLMMAAALLHVEGYDWTGDGPEPSRPLVEKQLPFLFSKWTETLTDCIKRADEIMALELEAVMEHVVWTPGSLRGLNYKALESGQTRHRSKILRCSTCGDDYAPLAAGLVEPRWIAFAECTKSKHRYSCLCSEFPRDPGAIRVTSTQRSDPAPELNCESENNADERQPAEESTENDQQTPRAAQRSHCDDGETSYFRSPEDANQHE